jgi:hypothetical protein
MRCSHSPPICQHIPDGDEVASKYANHERWSISAAIQRLVLLNDDVVVDQIYATQTAPQSLYSGQMA